MQISEIAKDSEYVEKLLTAYLKYLNITLESIRTDFAQLVYRDASINNLLTQITAVENLLRILHTYNTELLPVYKP